MVERRTASVALSVLAIVLAACNAPSQSGSPPAVGEARDPEFVLVISTPQEVWEAADVIDVQATLSYIGAKAETEVWSSVGGVVAFEVIELSGDRRMDAIRDLACARYLISPGQPVSSAYVKSVGIDPGEPNEDFYRQFFADPLLHLPKGKWRIGAWASFAVGECGGRQVDLRASLSITVND